MSDPFALDQTEIDAIIAAKEDAEADEASYDDSDLNDGGYGYGYDDGYEAALVAEYEDSADLLLYVPVSFRGTLTFTVAD